MTNKRSLFLIFLTVLMDLIGFGMIIPLSPYLARHFGADELQVGILMSIYSLMQFFFAPFWGRISDKKGRKPIIVLSLLGACVSHLGFAFAQSYVQLFLARMFAGFFGANLSTAMAYIADVTEEKDRSKGMGLIGAAFGLGFIIGPFFGAELAALGDRLGSLPPFGQSFAAIGAGAICFLNAIFAVRWLKESLSDEIRSKAVVENRQTKLPIERIRLLIAHVGRPTVGPLMQITLISTFSMALMEATLFLFVQDVLGWSIRQAGYGFAYVGIVMVFTQGYLIRKVIPKVGEKNTLLAGAILLAIGLAGIGLSRELLPLAFAVTFLGLGSGLLSPSVSGSISLLTRRDDQGMTIGVNQSFSAMGRIIGPAIGGWLYRDLGMQYPFLVGALTALIAFAIGLSIYAKLPNAGKAGDEVVA